MTSPKVAGELVSGRPSWRVASGFPTLGNSARPARVSARRTQSYARPAASVAIIDLLAIAGVDLRTQRWATRRSRLEQLAAGWSPYPD
jgi:ATP-dependent DNA ligase